LENDLHLRVLVKRTNDKSTAQTSTAQGRTTEIDHVGETADAATNGTFLGG